MTHQDVEGSWRRMDRYIEENFDISTLPDDAIKEINEGISTRIRLNPVVDTGVPGSIPRKK
jgi:hypothetical protein